ncbi:MAG TPA: polysaccharide deacetylase family protein [Terriglobales bacterium]
MLFGLMGGVAAAGAASWLGYNCYAPGSQLYGSTLFAGDDPRAISLTFDDGPNDPHTLRLLDVLAKYNVKATFFLVGKYVKQRPEIARAVVAAGHALGNHTYSHPNLLLCSGKRIYSELRDCARAIKDNTGIDVALFRPPFGARRPAVLNAARGLHYTTVMWNVTCFDWSATSSQAIEARAHRHIAKQTNQGKIVLLHDGGHLTMGTDRSHTVTAAGRLIARYQSEGYKFLTIPQIRRRDL